MKRLKFLLPDFVRISWVSATAQSVWQPRLSRITQAWLDIEWQSVLAGVRACGVTIVSPEEFVQKAGVWAKHGLNALPLEIQGLSKASYAATSVPAKPGEPIVFRVVTGTPQSVTKFKEAWDANDNQAIGGLLGYPECCQKFFQNIWVEKGLIDTTWPMAKASSIRSNGENYLAIDGSAEANILWRWMGVRPVPHLPCHFDCQPTIGLHRELMRVGRDAGFQDEVTWLKEILSWPVEWSALHGIAEIKTPILKVSTRTDATPIKYIVQKEGDSFPTEGAQGLDFPYLVPDRLKLSDSKSYHRGIELPIAHQEPIPEWYASDNGFSSHLAMDKAHQPLIDLASTTLSGKGGNVLDLGCGNGALLKKMLEVFPDITPYGIEIDPNRFQHVEQIIPEFSENIILGDMFQFGRFGIAENHFAMTLLMPGRLLEVDALLATRLRKFIDRQCDHLLVFAYGDWLTRFGDLKSLCSQVGIQLIGDQSYFGASLARVVKKSVNRIGEITPKNDGLNDE